MAPGMSQILYCAMNLYMSLIQKLFAYVNVSVSSANKSGVNKEEKASFGPSLGYPFPGFCQVC